MADHAVMHRHLNPAVDRGDQLFLDAVIEDAKGDAEVRERAEANALDNFSLSMSPKLEELMLRRFDLDHAFVSRTLNDAELKGFLFPLINMRIYDELRSAGAARSTSLARKA